MAENTEAIRTSINNVLTQSSVKEVVNAVATGIESCLDNAASASSISESMRIINEIDEKSNVVNDFGDKLFDINNKISQSSNIIISDQIRPNSSNNVIWIRPQSNTEYRMAGFNAFSSLWNLVEEINSVYSNGHGGVVSISNDTSYVDENETTIPEANRRIKQLIIRFSDGFEGKILYVCAEGQLETVIGTGAVVEYAKGEFDNGEFVKTPPSAKSWLSSFPELEPGDYLWIRATSLLKSGNLRVIYSVGRFGHTGYNNVLSFTIGNDGSRQTSEAVIPLDAYPSEDHYQYVVSSDGIWREANNFRDNVEFINSPTALTPSSTDNTTKLATTEFVNRAVYNYIANSVHDDVFFNVALSGVPTVPLVYDPTFLSSGNQYRAFADSSNKIASVDFVYWRTYELLCKKLTFKRGLMNVYDVHQITYNYGFFHKTINVDPANNKIIITVPELSSHLLFVTPDSMSVQSSCLLISRWMGSSYSINLFGEKGFSIIDNYLNTQGDICITFNDSVFLYFAHVKLHIIDFVLLSLDSEVQYSETYYKWAESSDKQVSVRLLN